MELPRAIHALSEAVYRLIAEHRWDSEIADIIIISQVGQQGGE